jgi:hypothetical protein
MKKIYVFVLMVVYLLSNNIFLNAQEDPFNWTEPIEVKANNVYLLWGEEINNAWQTFQKQYQFKIDSTWLDTDSLVSLSQKHADPRLQADPPYVMDAAAGSFNKDPYEDVVSIWRGQNAIQILMPEFDSSQAMWTTTVKDSIVAEMNNRIYVRTGDFDADDLDEFVITNVSADDSIHFYVYDVDSLLQPTLLSSICDETVEDDFDYFNYINYYIETGDFNGDGKDEIVLQSIDGNLTASAWTIFVKIYELNGSTLEAKARESIQPRPANTDLLGFNIAVAPGQFKFDDKEEIAFYSIIREGDILPGETESWGYLIVLEVSPDLEDILFDWDNHKTIFYGPDPQLYFGNHLGFAAGDLNNDGRDEIVYNIKSTLAIYVNDDDLNLTAKATIGAAEGGGYSDLLSYSNLEITDVNQDNRQEIVLVKNFVSNQFQDGFFVAMLNANDELDDISLVGRLFGDEPQYDEVQPYAIAVGNFDGYNFSIGQPVHYTENNIVQPIVILNTPPVHFDVFDDVVYDVNQCFNGGDCDFVATYKKVSDSSLEVSTSVRKDWAISAGVGGSGSVVAAPLGAGAQINYEAHLLGKWGRHFSKDSTQGKSVTVSLEVDARKDDWIYTTLTDYDLYEYPVYHGTETTPRRSILTMVPSTVQGSWFPSKSYNAINYISDHEVSNIMSYRDYDSINPNPNMSQGIRTKYTADKLSLNEGSDHDWSTTIADFESSSADTVKENGIDIGINFVAIFNFDFTKTRAVTHTTRVTNLIDLKVHLGSVDMGIGDVKYAITPYSYWSKNDALVVDYSVTPELSPPGFPPTWWQQQYGTSPDPTFILPWRLDPEKGFAISEPAKREQTKDITFSPRDPKPGDTLEIVARVRNYSLIPTGMPVSVSFYLGDPDSLGVPIIGINGSHTVSTIGPVLERGRSDVYFYWVIPDDLPAYPRIYAVLDEDDLINEIHDDNNKGFNVLGLPAINPSATEDHNHLADQGYSLNAPYPNPFRNYTNIEYTISDRSRVTIRVYDCVGNPIRTLIDKVEPAGEYILPFNASGLASGIYYYTLQAGHFQHTQKMILLK